MSEGPIKRERAAYSSQTASTPRASAIHAGGQPGRAYCGRRTVAIVRVWAEVTCADCHAAHRADIEAGVTT